MTTFREHEWRRPHFHGPDFCRACGCGRYDEAAQRSCKGPPIRAVTTFTFDAKAALRQLPAGAVAPLPEHLFVTVERRLVDYFDATLPQGSQTVEEAGTWYAEIKGYRVDLSSVALAIAQALEKRA